MNVIFDRSFNKSIDKINDKQVKEKLSALIVSMEQAKSISELIAINHPCGSDLFYNSTDFYSYFSNIVFKLLNPFSKSGASIFFMSILSIISFMGYFILPF